MKYQHLLGRPFEHGRFDCYQLIRDFYRDNFGIHLTNYARPDDWWAHGFSLYQTLFSREGFEVLEAHPNDWLPGDLFMISVRSKTPCHAGIYVGNNLMLHHFFGRFSETVLYRGGWRNRTNYMLRHRQAFDLVQTERHDVLDYLPEAKKQRYLDALN